MWLHVLSKCHIGHQIAVWCRAMQDMRVTITKEDKRDVSQRLNLRNDGSAQHNPLNECRWRISSINTSPERPSVHKSVRDKINQLKLWVSCQITEQTTSVGGDVHMNRYRLVTLRPHTDENNTPPHLHWAVYGHVGRLRSHRSLSWLRLKRATSISATLNCFFALHFTAMQHVPIQPAGQRECSNQRRRLLLLTSNNKRMEVTASDMLMLNVWS